MLRYVIFVFMFVFGAMAPAARAQRPMPLQSLAVSRTQIAFTYAGHVWVMDRQGGQARRLTSGSEEEGRPVFSPDGTQFAFWRDSGGNVDVYVSPASEGAFRRLTYHPKEDMPVGWSPDGKSVLFLSRRVSDSFFRLYTIPAQGGFETELPFPMAEDGALSPDGTSLAYLPRWDSSRSWRNYRGGTTTPIWIARLSDSHILDTVPRDNSNDARPMWVGDTLYFLSDRTHTVNLFAYEPQTKRVRQLTHYEKIDIRYASAGADAIAFVRGGTLHLFDISAQQVREIAV